MLLLRRTVRFAINPDPSSTPLAGPRAGPNGYAGVPAFRGLARHYELDVTCRGTVHPTTGYLINIKDIDAAVRAAAIPLIAQACKDRPTVEPAGVLSEFLPALNSTLADSVQSVRWRLTPYYSVEMAPSAPAAAILRQRFEFAASHRLHSPSLSAEENRRVFGKCNNPTGHGHNYILEPAVAVTLDAQGRQPFALEDMERIVASAVIDRFDHMHLNIDVPQFDSGSGGGLNPSVENIARVSYDLLKNPIRQAGGDLRSVTVWETEKTSCTYPA
jgi:6-pyruvoyltetrahydropterin/6-carboxytetrahydropterin synthase